MMMVDTINPNTDEPDNFIAPAALPVEPVVQPQTDQLTGNSIDSSTVSASEAPVSTSADDHFFGGFDKPDDMKINLAGTPGEAAISGFDAPPVVSTVSTPQQSMGEPVSLSDLAPVTPQTNSFETQVHSSYNKASSSNSKLVMIVAAAGVAAVLLVGGVSYFIMNSANNSKLATQQEELAQLKSSLASLQATPDSLQVATETPTTENIGNQEDTTTTVPVVTTVPETTPVEITGDQSEQPSGARGDGKY